ncbi:MAG: hypothetical protein KJO80_01605 [Gammaproteobacteria bacterium]|nr:hypothetical protein [Gammaproteobacteria bacterium]
MRDEYDFKSGEIGKFAKRYKEGSNLVLLDPEVAKYFPDSKSVNRALLALIAKGKVSLPTEGD